MAFVWGNIFGAGVAIPELYVVRHGQTDYNLKGIVQGRGVDSSLNEKGREQAAAFHAAYGGLVFDGLYASSLARSGETIAAFAKPGLPLGTFAHLDEISWGRHEGKAPSEAMSADYYRMKAAWEAGDFTACIPGGESPLQVAGRLAEFLEYLHAQGHKRALICSHGRTAAILLCLLLGDDLCNMERHRLDNTGLCILNGTPGGYRLAAHSGKK